MNFVKYLCTSFMRNLIFSFAAVLVLVGSPAHAQEDEFDATMVEINKLLGEKTVVSYKKEELTVEVFKNGKVYRRDRVYVKDLNADATSYIEDEYSVVLRCSRKPGACVDKKLFLHKRHKSQNQYTRLAILIKGNEGIKDELVANFKKLILLYQK